VLPVAQTVGPVQPVPAHWPNLVCVAAGAELVLVVDDDVLFVVEDDEDDVVTVVDDALDADDDVEAPQTYGLGPGIV